MKRLLITPLLCLATLAIVACGCGEDDTPAPPTTDAPTLPGSNEETQDYKTMTVNIIVNGRTISATMEDNAAARDLMSRMPIEVTLNDFNNTTEKIFYPSPALTTNGVKAGCAPTPGDITIYVPWGNVSIFCKSWPYSSDLIKIGHIDGNGIDALAHGGDITIKMSRK